MSAELSPVERLILLKLARGTILDACNGEALAKINPNEYSQPLREMGASFVTLTKKGELRGCVGALEAFQSLVADVQEHAFAAAFRDYRFPPVQAEEIVDIAIEISRLTQPQPLSYLNAEDLLVKLRPDVDGVILRDGIQRATFLPQVWEKLPDASEFLSHLCQKMGVSPDHWRHKKIEVLIYQVEMFQE